MTAMKIRCELLLPLVPMAAVNREKLAKTLKGCGVI
jgi:hypothetical protein